MLPLSRPRCLSLGLLNSLLTISRPLGVPPPMQSPGLSQINPLKTQIWSCYFLSKTFRHLLWLHVALVRINSKALMIRFLQNAQLPFWQCSHFTPSHSKLLCRFLNLPSLSLLLHPYTWLPFFWDTLHNHFLYFLVSQNPLQLTSFHPKIHIILTSISLLPNIAHGI